MMVGSPGSVRCQNSEKLEFANPLNENARFLRSHGLQHDPHMVIKGVESSRKSREEEKREQRREESTLKSAILVTVRVSRSGGR